MKTKAKLLIGVAALVPLGIFVGSSFQSNLTPYVGFADAMAKTRPCQIMGTVDKEFTKYDYDRRALVFRLLNEKGERIVVEYEGPKPGNFDQAKQVVAIGLYENGHGTFKADKLLVKCPSKYEQNGEDTRQYESPKKT